MNSATMEAWHSFKSSLVYASSPKELVATTTSTAHEVATTSVTTNAVWHFLGNVQCPVIQVIDKVSHCVDLKTFTAYSIRNVVLELQSRYNIFDIGTKFFVNRFSNEAGTMEEGKYLNGRFEGSDAVFKVSHQLFVIQDEESPPKL